MSIHCNSCVGLRGCSRITRCHYDTEYVRQVHGIQLHRDIQWRRWKWRLEWSGVEWSGVEWSGVEWSGVDVAAPQSQQEFMEHVQLTPRTRGGGTHEIVFSGRLGLCFFAD